MAIDLYRDDFSRLTDIEVFQGIEAFTRINEPIAVRPRESFLLDFKQEWGDKALRTVAGFAHTFGGLLIVGVSEKDAQPDQLVGVESVGELKTSIASSIATNISPTPSYEIAECKHPGQPSRKLAVVRVRQGHQLYYFTKKGDRPIYVRNEDESVPADAAQLRSLIERKTSASQRESEVTHRIKQLRPKVLPRQTPYREQVEHPPYLQILLSPFDHPGLILDSAVEQQFRKLIRNFSFHYRDVEIKKEEDRGIDWYGCRWSWSDKQESVWRITSSGDVAYATVASVFSEQGSLPLWSLGDAVVDLLFLLGVARSLWKQSSYYGEAQLVVNLEPRDLSMHTALASDVWSGLSATASHEIYDFNAALKDSIVSSAEGSSTASATGMFNSGLPYDAVTEMVANIVNQVLRCMKYSADLNILRRAVEGFLRAAR
jgi:hypothetical protein